VRILIKTVFGQTLFHSQDEVVSIKVEKGDVWHLHISGMEQAVVEKILEHQSDVHAFYFERNHKWWLSFTSEPVISFDEANHILHLSFDSIFEYQPEQM
jgi:hypothetical protein